jgi:deoxyhypusine synthase
VSANGHLPDPRHRPLDLSGLKLYPIHDREHIVKREHFGKCVEPDCSAGELLDSLPKILGADRLRALAEAIAQSRSRNAGVIFALGGHVVKTGLGPLLADLAERGVITGFALNGAAAIHDFEVALLGQTSEKVAETIETGKFGMVKETGAVFNRVCKAAAQSGKGFGRALAEEIAQGNYPGREDSLVYRAARAGVPVTVHVSIGTDTVHAIPDANGAEIGAATFTDFKILAGIVKELDHGCWVNIGSAVLLPEVFLKCVSVARNLGGKVEGVTAANLDMIQHYRPRVNVLERPVDRGIEITGHHEILVPLLRLETLRRLATKGVKPRRPEATTKP